MTQADMQQIAVTVAHQYGLDPALVCAMCEHESSWNPEAERYEPAFFDHYIRGMAGLSDEELRLRATSLGLMQIMGQVAREQGYQGDLNHLREPANSCVQGAKKFQRCLKSCAGDVTAALLKYNGGGAPEYPGLVLQFYEKYKVVV